MVIRVERVMESAYKTMSCLEATLHISNWDEHCCGFQGIQRAKGDLTKQQFDRILCKRVLLKGVSFIAIPNDTGLICCSINVCICPLKERVKGI